MYNYSIVADTFKSDEVAFGDVRGIELNGGVAVVVRFYFGIPVERCAMVWAGFGRRVCVLWGIEVLVGLPSLLLYGGHGEWAEDPALQARLLPDEQQSRG